MNLRCEACQRSIQLGVSAVAKYAGRRVRCPNCGQPVQVPTDVASTPVADLPTETAAEANAVSAEQAAVPAPVEAAKPTKIPHIDAGPGRRSGIHSRNEPKHAASPAKSKRKKNSVWLVAAGGGGLALVGVVTVVVILISGGGKGGGSSSPSRRAAAGGGTIEIALSDDARGNTSLVIDGKNVEIAASGVVRKSMLAGTHQVTLRRRGYEQIDATLVVRAGDAIQYRPDWKPLSLPGLASGNSGVPAYGDSSTGAILMQLTFDDWLQDFEQAKQEAAKTNKKILVLFDGSDWCPYSMQMADQVFFDRRFGPQIAQQYLLVRVDFPQTAGGKAKVQDSKRNSRLAERFGVQGFPTIVVTDENGLPFGRMGYVEGGFDEFDRQLGEFLNLRDQLNSRLAQAEGAGTTKLQAARETLKLVSELKFERFYLGKFRQWYEASQKTDPDNQAGQQEVFLAIWWLASLSELDEDDAPALATRAAELDAWGEKHQFVDRELAGRLYLQAAWLVKTQPERVKQYAEKGLSFGPREETTQGMLSLLKNSAQELNVLGSGSGFIVAHGGYVLTNRHVASGPGRLVVRWPGAESPLSAQVVKDDKEHDLALLRVEVPDGNGPHPLRLSAQSPGRGASVAAFGFPLGEMVGKGLKLTTGVVSATDEQTQNGMILLDCRVNPGNSGGPLCNPRGEVIGVVSARSLASAEVDSYGMAIPGSVIRKFLTESLPSYNPEQLEQGELGDGGWDAVDRLVSPSVLIVERLRK